ncbi:MAG: insulinase family protein [Bacteroidetes bacterium]|nr:insulinase family protein [Bacteroidota bacterium]
MKSLVRMKIRQINAFTHSLARSDPQYRETVLPSGLRVVTETVPSVHSLAVGIWIDAGSRDETDAQSGIAHFIEHTVFKGTERRRTHHIAQFLEAVGGYINAFTTKDATCYYARVLQPHLPRAVHLLADLVQNPVFPVKEIEKEKQVIIDELRGAEDDPEDLAHEYFEALLFGTHPLGRPILGREDVITELTREGLLSFVRQQYTAGNITVAAAGAVDHEQLVALCRDELSLLPAGKQGKRRKPRRGGARSDLRQRPVQQTHLVVGSMAGGYHHRSRHALSVLNALLGDGMSSRLFQRIRERHGYGYNIYSFLSMYHDVSTFGVYAGLEPAHLERARALILRELDTLAETRVSTRELNRAKEQVIGGMLMGMESMTNRMTRIARDTMVFGRDIPVACLVEDIQAVDAEALRVLAADVFDARRRTEIRLQPI